MAERAYTADEAQKLEERYQSGQMAPANRPLWEQRRQKYLPSMTPQGDPLKPLPALESVNLQPQPPAAMQALPSTPVPTPQPSQSPGASQAQTKWNISFADPAESAAGPPAGMQVRGAGPSLEAPLALEAATKSAQETYPVGGARPAQAREQQFEAMHKDVEEAKGQVETGAEMLAMTLLSQIPGGQVVAASRYARLAPAARQAYWALREVIEPLARYGVISAGTGAVPLLFGKPMSEAIQTALFTAVGEMTGGVVEKGRAKVVKLLSESMSPEGEMTGKILGALGQKTTVGDLTGAAWLKRVEDAFRSHLWEGRLGKISREQERSIGGELLSRETRTSAPGQVRRSLEEPPAWLNTTQGDVPHPARLIQNEIETKEQAFQWFMGKQFESVDELIAGGRPDTGGFPRTTMVEDFKPAWWTSPDVTSHLPRIPHREPPPLPSVGEALEQARVFTEKPPGPELQTFVRQMGGLKIEGETLKTDWQPIIQNREVGTSGLLNNQSGKSLQEIANAAQEAGYIKTADTEALREALDESVNLGWELYPHGWAPGARTPRGATGGYSPEARQRPPLWQNLPKPGGEEYPFGSYQPPHGSGPVPRGAMTPGRPSATVNVSKAQAIAAEMLADAKRAGLSTEGGMQILTDILAKQPSMSFKDAQRLRSDLLAVTRQSTDLLPGKARQYADRLSAEIDAAMQRTAMGHGGEVYTRWRQANAAYKEGAQLFEDQVVRRIMQAGPDDIMATIARPGSPYEIRRARQAVDNQVIWSDVQAAWLRNVMGDPAITNPLNQTVQGQALLTRLQTFSKPALRELFPGGHGEELFNLTQTLAQIQRGGGAAPWNRVVQGVRGGGLALVLGYEGIHQMGQGRYERGEDAYGPERQRWPYAVGVPLTIMLSPMLMSRIFSSQKLTRAMLEGASAAPNARRRMEIAGGILALLTEEGLLKGETQADVPQAVGTTP